MQITNKVDKNFKRDFNLGYQLAVELDLKAPMFIDEKNTSSNPIHLGILQFINEAEIPNSKNLENSVNPTKNHLSKKSSNRKDKGLSI